MSISAPAATTNYEMGPPVPSAVCRNLCSLLFSVVFPVFFSHSRLFLLSNRNFRGCCVALAFWQPPAPNPAHRSFPLLSLGPKLGGHCQRRNMCCVPHSREGTTGGSKPVGCGLEKRASSVVPFPLKEEGAKGDLD